MFSWYLEEFSPVGAPFKMNANVLAWPTESLTGSLSLNRDSKSLRTLMLCRLNKP